MSSRNKKVRFMSILVMLAMLFSFANVSPAAAATNAWTPAASMTVGRAVHTATLLANGKVLVAGGGVDNTNTYLASAELYDPATNTWTAAGSMAVGRVNHTATLLADGRVLVAGGNNSTWLASAELYDPATNTWTAAGSMTEGRGNHTATLLPNGKVLVAGGIGVQSAELYDPATNTWTPAGSMTLDRYDHTATLLADGRVLVAGGYNYFTIDDITASAELYDPATNTWTPAGSMTQPRELPTATRLASGKVLVAGGCCSAPQSAELYDPATDTWTPAGSMTIARGFHTATRLADGRVLVAGGSGSLASAELYDPATSTWTATDSMTQPRELHTATLLKDGRVLVAGGVFGNSAALASAELYVVPNTPVGSNVPVQPVDQTSGTAPVTLTFVQVTQAGTTSLVTSGTGTPPPNGFKLGNPPVYYDLSTTAVFAGQVSLCIDYTGVSFGNESNLKLNHYENGAWVDRTLSLDTTTNIICASVPSLSPFAIFEPESDAIAPTAAPSISSGTAGANGWYTSDVTVDWNWTDNAGGSGIDTANCTAYSTSTSEGNPITLSATCKDLAGNTGNASYDVKVDKTKPTLNPIVSPNPVLLNGMATVTSGAADDVSGLFSSSCGALDTSTVGTKSVTCTATDNAGNSNSAMVSYNVNYNWSGFLQPVDNLPMLNSVKAGSAVPVKFSLAGNQGLNIFAAGYPASQQIACSSTATDAIETTVTAGSSSLSYDATTDQYNYVWKTDKAWAGTCRTLTVKLIDGTIHQANFKFTR